jgi:quinol monooxygenase YgiN
MKVIVAGTLRIGPDKIQRLRPHMLQMLTASRAEDGCFTYSYAEDAGEPGLIRIFEVWRDEAALQAHFQTDHIARWRAALAELGPFDRRLTLYEVASERPT